MFFITNRTLVDEDKYYETIKEASYLGVNNIILREKDLNDKEYCDLYYKVCSIVKPGTNVIIHSKINVLNKVKSDTIHLTYKDFMNFENINKLNIGVSIHSVEEGIEANKKGASYLLASHIFETKCKEGLKPKGLDLLESLSKNIKCKIVALGGINEENYKETLEAGADDFAVMSLLFNSPNLKNTIYKLQGGQNNV
ncbi:MAG: thiamine phosphate synthase [Peptostreptococcaceae bacterium]